MLGLMVDLNPEFIYYLLLLSVLCRRTADCGASVAVTVVSADMLLTLCKTVCKLSTSAYSDKTTNGAKWACCSSEYYLPELRLSRSQKHEACWCLNFIQTFTVKLLRWIDIISEIGFHCDNSKLIMTICPPATKTLSNTNILTKPLRGPISRRSWRWGWWWAPSWCAGCPSSPGTWPWPSVAMPAPVLMSWSPHSSG